MDLIFLQFAYVLSMLPEITTWIFWSLITHSLNHHHLHPRAFSFGFHQLRILPDCKLVLLVKKLLGLSSHASLHGHRTPEWNTKLSFRCEALAWSGICTLNYPVINMISLPNGMTSNKSGITLAITSFMSIPKNIPCSSPKHRTIPSPKGRKWPR